MADTGYAKDNQAFRGVDQHIGGKKAICPSCSVASGARRCLFYTAKGDLTPYAFACGYVETRGRMTLSKEGCWHVKGFSRTDLTKVVWENFDTLSEARKFFRSFPKKEKVSQ